MMFERFTDDARAVVADAQQHARRLGHGYIGCEHLLLAAASGGVTADVLRQHGLTAESVQVQLARVLAPGQPLTLSSLLDGDALASIGIDLDSVRARIDAAFGPDALALAACAVRRRQSVCRQGPFAEMARRRARRSEEGAALTRLTGHMPLTPRAKQCLERSQREADALGSGYIGSEHLALAIIAADGGPVPAILHRLGVTSPALRVAIINRDRKAS